MITSHDILTLIEPVDPDKINYDKTANEWHLGWWEPWQMMDLYLLERTDGVTIARTYEKYVGLLHFLFVVIWVDDTLLARKG